MSKFTDGLKAIGLNDEQITSIVKIKNESGEDIPKYRFDEINTKKNELEDRLKSQETQFKELEASVGENASLKTQLEDMKKQRDDAKAESNKKIKEFVRRNNLLMTIMEKYDCYNPEDVIRNLKQEEITYDENNKPVSGLDNQVEALKTSAPYYFKPAKTGDGVINTHKPDGPNNGDKGEGGEGQQGFFTDSLF